MIEQESSTTAVKDFNMAIEVRRILLEQHEFQAVLNVFAQMEESKKSVRLSEGKISFDMSLINPSFSTNI